MIAVLRSKQLGWIQQWDSCTGTGLDVRVLHWIWLKSFGRFWRIA